MNARVWVYLANDHPQASGIPAEVTAPRLSLTQPYRITGNGSAVHLTPQEALILLALMGNARLTREEAAEILWPCAAHMPDQWYLALRVIVSRLRAKLAGHGWSITDNYRARRGLGWSLEEIEADSRRQAA